MRATERADRGALAERAGDFEPVEVKWFNRVKGYGFIIRVEIGAARTCSCTWRRCARRSSGIFSRGSGWKRGLRTATRA